jgi:hypothetical protein
VHGTGSAGGQIVTNITRHNGVTLYELGPVGSLLGDDLTVQDLLGEAYDANPDIIVVPASRLAASFLELRSRVAGEVFQKMEQYSVRLVVMGDVSAQIAASKALHDFVYETNQRGHHMFVPDRDSLLSRL